MFRRLLQRLEQIAPAHSMQPVPDAESVPGYRVAIVCVGIAFTLTGLYMGSEIGLEMGWRRGVYAAVVGSIILAVMSIPAAIVGARTRLSTYTGNGVANGVMLVLAMIPALAFAEQDPMKYMAQLSLVLVAFTILVLSTWSVNAVNLYSTGLVTATAFPSRGYGQVVIGCGIVGTLLALLGLADRFVDFLVILGLIVPPIASVYLTDFFILGRTGYRAECAPETNVSGLVACALGASIGRVLYLTKTSVTGVPTIESFISGSGVYWALETLRARSRRDRLWRL